MDKEFTFRIEGSYSPQTFPLARLGEYLEALGQLFGEKANVHFASIEEGSTLVRAIVDHVAAPKVEQRVAKVQSGEGGAGAVKAFAAIDDMLRDDNATGTLLGENGKVIFVDFPGRNRPQPVAYGPIKQFGSIDGEVYRVEGRDKTVHVGIMDNGRTFALEAHEGMGQSLATLFRAGPVRFHGEGTWRRMGPGEWDLKRFKIDRVERLGDAPVSKIVEQLREIGSGGWAQRQDPLGDIAVERDDQESEH